jgi:uncharacterized protein YecT (DUF1311 family)
MLVRYLACLAALAACFSLPAQAQQAAPPIDCAVASSTPELLACAQQRLAAADKELAGAVERARKRIATVEMGKTVDRAQWRKELDAAQSAWAAFRKADCEGLLPHEWDSGTGTNLAVTECLAQLTENRAFEINERYGGNK